MDSGILALVSGLVGALIGACASVVAITIQNHYQTKREMQKLAIEIAMEEYRARLRGEFGDIDPTPGPILVAYYAKLTRLAADDKLTPDAIRQLFDSQRGLAQAYAEAYHGEREQPAQAARGKGQAAV